MAFKNIKGLTVEIGGDTTKLGKALEDVNKKSTDLSKELGEVNKLLKMDPGNADLLAQKQKILAEAVENTAKKLETLKEAEKQVQKQFEKGEVSEEQVRALKREVEAATQKLDGYKNAARETADEVENLGKKSKSSAEDLNSIANGGLATVGGLVTSAAGALTAAAESTREYRTEMGKLDTAFTEAGHRSEAATQTYQALQGILGETDQAVEASNHLAKLAQNEKDLSTWTDICTGVYATFGASLPIEGLTEAANETAKTGALTGSLADALNWAGVNEEEFQAKLDACNTEQERQALITETLNGLYSETADKYRETNAEVIAANEANEKWQASMAEVGAAVEPVLTNIKEIGAELLGKLVPVVETLLNNLPTVAVALAGITAALVSYKVAALAATAAEKGMTLAQYAAAAAQKVLNAVFAANPIGIVLVAITALVTAFMYLWKNCEGFREFWINLWEKIKSITSTAINAVVNFFQQLPERLSTWLTNTIEKVTTWATNLATRAKEAGRNFLDGVVNFFKNLPYNVGYLLGMVIGKTASWVVNMAIKAKEAGKQFLDNVVNFFKNLPENAAKWLTSTISKVSTWATNLAAKAKTAGKNFLTTVVNFFKQLPSNAWNLLVQVVTKVSTWATNLATKGKSAAKSLVDAVVNGIKNLPSKIMSVGKDLVTGLWNGVQDKFNWLKSKLKSFTSGVLDGIKDFFGVHSPSKETAWIGEMLDEGLAQGVTDAAKTPVRAMQRVSGSVLDAAAGMGGIGFERSLSGTRGATTAAAAAVGNTSALLAKLDGIYERLGRLQVVLDSGTLVGETIDKIDAALGTKQLLSARGV